MFVILKVAFAVLIISSIFSAIGYMLWRRISAVQNTHWAPALSASFFIGVSLFISSFGILTQATGSARVAMAVCLVVIGGTLVLERNWFEFFKKHRSHINYIIGIIFVVGLIQVFAVLQPLPRSVLSPSTADPSYGIGIVDHTFRVENISHTFVTNNSWLYLNQNSGQAIIASLPQFFNINAPQISIFFFYIVISVMATVFVYAAARTFLTPKLAVIPTVLVALGNTSLSYVYAPLTEFGHPLLLLRNFEVIIGVVTTVIASMLVYNILRENGTYVEWLSLSVIIISWSIVGGQFSLILIGVLGAFLVGGTLSKNSKRNAAFLVGIIVVCIVGGSLVLGGVFAFDAPDSHIPGVKSVHLEGGVASPISLRPFRTVESELHFDLKLAYILNHVRGNSWQTKSVAPPEENSSQNAEVAAVEADNTSIYSSFYAHIAYLKESPSLWNVIRFVRSVQLVFFPLLGVCLGYIYLFRNTKIHEVVLREYYRVMVIVFLGTWILASMFSIYGSYGEMGRFMSVGILSAMFFLGVMLAKMIQLRERYAVLGTSAVLSLSLVPVALTYIVIVIYGNQVLPPTEFMLNVSGGATTTIPIDDVVMLAEKIKLFTSESVVRGAK